jgi:plastocyanin
MSRRAVARQAAQDRTRQRLVWGAAGLAFLAVLVVVVVALSGGGGDGGGTASPGSGIRVSMTDYAFEPDPLVLSGDDKVVTIVNDGEIPHDFVVPELGKGTPDLPPGGELTIDFSDQPAGTYEVVCDITGHREAGMVSQLIIE